MADATTIAVVAVISSSVVALAGSGVQLWIAHLDRRDNVTTRREDRIWTAKSKALDDVSAMVDRMHQVIIIPTRDDHAREMTVIYLLEIIDSTVYRVRGPVQTYGSATTRACFDDLVASVNEMRPARETWWEIRRAREAKRDHLRDEDFEAAAQAHQRDRKVRDGLHLADQLSSESQATIRERMATLMDAVRTDVGLKGVNRLAPAGRRNGG